MKTYSNFDIFNIAFYRPDVFDGMLHWDEIDCYIPMVYFALNGLPDSALALREDFSQTLSRTVPGSLLLTLLKESLEETYDYKSRSLLPSTVVMKLLLDQCLPGLDEVSPHTSARLTEQNQTKILHLFKIAGKQVYNDPDHTAILLDAFNRFMQYYPACPISHILDHLVAGMSYYTTDKNVFYFTAIEILYQKALKLYYPHDKESLWQSINKTFGCFSQDARSQTLKDKLSSDLLDKDFLTVQHIVSFDWDIEDYEHIAQGTTSINRGNPLKLSEKFKTLIAGMKKAELLALLNSKEVSPSCKIIIADSLFEKIEKTAFSETDLVALFNGIDTFSIWGDSNRLIPKLKISMQGVTTPSLLLSLMKGDRCGNCKLLLINRFVELGAWDDLTTALSIHSQERSSFPRILQLLKDNGQLDGERMIYAAEWLSDSNAVDDLLAKAEGIVFTKTQFDKLSHAISTNPNIENEKAQAWIKKFTPANKK